MELGAYIVIGTCRETKGQEAKLIVTEAASTEPEAKKPKFAGFMI